MTRRRLLRRAACGLLVTSVALVVVYVFVLPRIVRRQIISRLAAAGLADADLHVVRSTAWRLDLADLSVGRQDPARIAQIDVSYSPSFLSSGRVSGIRLVGVELDMGVSNGKITLGPLAALKSSARSDSAPGPLDLPFDRIDLESSFTTLHLFNRDVRVAMQGSFIRLNDDRYTVVLDLTAGTNPIRITGTIGPTTGDADLAMSGASLDADLIAAIASAFATQTFTASGRLTVDAAVHYSKEQGTVSLKAGPDSVSLAAAPKDPAGEPTRVQGVSGTLSIEAALAASAIRNGSVTIGNLSFKVSSASVEAIDGTVVFSDLTSLTTAPSQHLNIGAISVGKALFASGGIDFGLAGPHDIAIQQAKWTWLGGTISADAFRVDPSRPKLDLTVKLAAVDLGQLLDYFAKDKATGEGKLSGELPVMIDWPKLQFGKGLLQASPGGTIQVKDLKAMAAALDQSGQAGIKDQVFEALGDFNYDVLRADLKNDSAGLMADIHLAGRGRIGKRTPLDTELRLHGLDDLLKLYLGY